MSYETMEAVLVTRIAGLRNTETDFERSLQAARMGDSSDLAVKHRQMHSEIREIEQLLAAMDAAAMKSSPMAAFLRTDAGQPMSSSVWA